MGHIKQIQAGCAACKSLTFSESVKSACVRGGIQNATQLLKCFLGKQKGGAARNNLNGKPNLTVFMSMLQKQVNAVLTRQGLVISETECHLAWGPLDLSYYGGIKVENVGSTVRGAVTVSGSRCGFLNRGSCLHYPGGALELGWVVVDVTHAHLSGHVGGSAAAEESSSLSQSCGGRRWGRRGRDSGQGLLEWLRFTQEVGVDVLLWRWYRGQHA